MKKVPKRNLKINFFVINNKYNLENCELLDFYFKDDEKKIEQGIRQVLPFIKVCNLSIDKLIIILQDFLKKYCIIQILILKLNFHLWF